MDTLLTLAALAVSASVGLGCAAGALRLVLFLGVKAANRA